MSDTEEQPSLDYQYQFSVACSADSFLRNVRMHFKLGSTTEERAHYKFEVNALSAVESSYRTLLHSNAPRPLHAHVARHDLPFCIKEVATTPIGSNSIKESFIPLMPVLQEGERLGFPRKGYFYHFLGRQLIQEYKIDEQKCRSSFCPTYTRGQHLKSDELYNQLQNALLVYWKIAGQVVRDQYLIYLPQAITAQQLADVDHDFLIQHGIEIHIPTILQTLTDIHNQPSLAQTKAKTEHPQKPTHQVGRDAQTGQRETWPQIAAQYQLSAKALLDLNPYYDKDPSKLRAGDILVVGSVEQEDQSLQAGLPQNPPHLYNLPFASIYEYPAGAPLADGRLTPCSQPHRISKDILLANLSYKRTLRIAIFFDEAGYNLANDAYKEQFGQQERSHIARLYAAYPQEVGKSCAIYISGVDTVDDIELIQDDQGKFQNNATLDEGLNQTPLLRHIAKDSARPFVGEATSGFYKWQQLLKQLKAICTDPQQQFDDIEHVTFDVFGFGQGGILARHFVNAARTGLPDYEQPATHNILHTPTYPNLLMRSNGLPTSQTGYACDQKRSTSVRFLGLFDSVGSFYWPEQSGEGNFNLALTATSADRVVQLCAVDEFRHTMPLTSIFSQGQAQPDNFFEENFRGSHADIGGGYLAKSHYHRCTPPLASTYNRELIDFQSFEADYQEEKYLHPDDAPINRHKKFYLESILTRESQRWQQQCQQEDHHGEVKIAKAENGDFGLFYYRLRPISNALSGLTLERMKQQAAVAGVKWQASAYQLPTDYQQDQQLQRLWHDTLSSTAAGKISVDMASDIQQLTLDYIHRPHDTLIQAGYESEEEQDMLQLTRNKQGDLSRTLIKL